MRKKSEEVNCKCTVTTGMMSVKDEKIIAL